MNTPRTTVQSVLVIVALAMAAVSAGAQAPRPATAKRLSPATGPSDIGLVFSADTLLLDLESYEAGIGAKFGSDRKYLRGVFDLMINGASRSFLLNVGATGEYHLLPGAISPYVGGFAEAGYMYQAASLSAFPFSVGAVAGVEVFIFDFLSVFAEYTLACEFSITTDLAASLTTFDYLVDTRMGNSSKLGLIVYLMRAGAK